MDLFDFLLQRPVIIALAVGGAIIATVGGVLGRKSAKGDPRIARFVLRFGYAVTWLSVALFIAAGFFGA